MEFGELTIEELEKADLSLPADRPETARVLKNAGKNKTAPRVYIGCPNWAQKEWVGNIYPPKTKAADFLHYYSRQFNSIELNTTFYNTPAEATLQHWQEEVPEDFRFCPKIPQRISHIKRLKDTNEIMADFIKRMRLLKHQLGMSFLQLPPNFGYKHFGTLEEFLKSIPDDIDFSVEFRDPSWFAPENIKNAFDLLEAHNISAVITDVAGKREVLHQRLTTPKVYIRFNAYDGHPTDYSRMDDWAIRIKGWLALGLQELYFMMHTPSKPLNPELANYMTRQLNEKCGLHLKECTLVQDTR